MRETASNYGEAIERYRRVMQRAVSCVSQAVLYVGPSPLSDDHNRISLNSYEEPIRLTTERGFDLSLKLWQQGLVKDDERPERAGEMRVTTLAYRYAIYGNVDGAGEPLIYWHWDVDRGRDPHVHTTIVDPMGRGMRLHIPTGLRRVSIEQVIRALIDEWTVVPARDDWDDCLADGQARYDAYRVRDRDSN